MSENFWDMLMGDDEHAATYMESYNEGPGAKTREVLAKQLRPRDKVLDVGCGPGWNFDHFLEHGPSVLYRGIDYSERFVRVANQRTGMNIFKKGDARHLEEPDKSFNVVILQDCLEHTNGYEIPVQEALRVANRKVLITFWHLTDDDNPHINDDGNDGWGAWYDKRDWEKYLDTLPVDWYLEEFEFPEGRLRHLYILRLK